MKIVFCHSATLQNTGKQVPEDVEENDVNDFWKRFWIKIGRDGLIMFGAAFLIWSNANLIPFLDEESKTPTNAEWFSAALGWIVLTARRGLALYFALKKLKDGDKTVIDGSFT